MMFYRLLRDSYSYSTKFIFPFGSGRKSLSMGSELLKVFRIQRNIKEVYLFVFEPPFYGGMTVWDFLFFHTYGVRNM